MPYRYSSTGMPLTCEYNIRVVPINTGSSYLLLFASWLDNNVLG